MWFMVWPSTAVLVQVKGLQTGAGRGTRRCWVKRKSTFWGQLRHQRKCIMQQEMVIDTVPAGTTIYVSPSCTCCLQICISVSQSQFSTKRNQSCIAHKASQERQFSLCAVDMWYHLCLPPLDWQKTQLKGTRAPGTKVSNIHPPAPSRSPGNESSYKRKEFFFT